MFCMWLVRSGIANLLSLPTLEQDGYVCLYHTNSPWIVKCPDGTILKFKRDCGLCGGFPYIDMENLQDRVFRPTSTSRNTVDHLHDFEPAIDFGKKVKALKELPKRKAFAFLQTVRQNMEDLHKTRSQGS